MECHGDLVGRSLLKYWDEVGTKLVQSRDAVGTKFDDCGTNFVEFLRNTISK